MKKPTLDQIEELGSIADACDNVVALQNIPIPVAVRLDSMKAQLQSTSAKIKLLYIQLTGNNPWKD